jgi:hypothetical protein
MAYRTYNNLPADMYLGPGALKGVTLMKSILFTALAVMALAAVSPAAELPEAPSSVIGSNEFTVEASSSVETSRSVAFTPAPEIKVVDAKFVSLALISTGSAFGDSYTTLFARQNWLAGKKGVCNAEVESAYLYGTHPTVARTYAVATAKSLGSALGAYYLRKHHNRFWSLPMIANAISSLQGTTQNMIVCN